MCRYLQAYKEGGKVRLVAPNNTQSFPGRALLEHLGHVHDLPRSLGLRVEVDGVLGEQVHDAVVKGDSYVFCAAAFQPLVGKQYVAWRFIRPDTLVCAVKIAGCSVAAAGGGGEEEEEAQHAASGTPPTPLGIRQQQPLARHAHTASKRGATGTLADLEEARRPSMLVRKHQILQVRRWWGGWVHASMPGSCRLSSLAKLGVTLGY